MFVVADFSVLVWSLVRLGWHGLSPQFLDELRARVGLADVIGRRVRLTRKGRGHVGLCPFHKEKTPSFTVNEEKGFYHCFGCGEHGSAIDFVMKTEGLSFPEAVERLAAEAGLEVPADTPEERDRARQRQTLYGVMEAAAAFYARSLRLPEGKAALEYCLAAASTTRSSPASASASPPTRAAPSRAPWRGPAPTRTRSSPPA